MEDLQKNFRKIYRKFIYSYGAKDLWKRKVFKKNASLMFTDLDTDWLINERHRDLNDWNGIDIISMMLN
jgi:hypothetical protein